MNQRFIFYFTDVERMILKNYKVLKSKNKYSLRQAEFLIKLLQKEWVIPIVLSVHCDDMTNDMTYVFDSIQITPINGEIEEMPLLRHIEKQVLSSGMENAQQLMMAIHHQYSEEKPIDENLKVIRTTPKKKFFKWLKR